MKTKHTIGILLTLLIQATGTWAQMEGGGIGIGVGLGVGVGSGLGGNIDVERVPAQVVQGRRVFAAKLVHGGFSRSNTVVRPTGVGRASGIPRGWGEGSSTSYTIESREYFTVVTLFNPTTNSVTVSYRSSGPVPLGIGSLTLAPMSSSSVSTLGLPGPVSLVTGFLAMESATPLEVVALYHYRDERLEGQADIWVETSAGTLFGPGF